ncbi:MAG: hypothetical protein EOO44_05430 [Flavobacterium sp.]|nr:MAG: hypothetical protein EOO44_05430 [Flavobacterium sp.]
MDQIKPKFVNKFEDTLRSASFLPDDTIRYLFNLIPTIAKQISYGKLLLYNIENLLSGAIPPAFNALTPEGKKVKLSDFRANMFS